VTGTLRGAAAARVASRELRTMEFFILAEKGIKINE
jgi:hypothetical protein